MPSCNPSTTTSLARLVSLALAACVTALPAAAQTGGHGAGHAHVHGVSKLELSVEAKQLNLRLEAPLDNLVGFERAPRTAAERQRVDEAVAKLRAADALFTPDPAAGCKLRTVELRSAVLKLGDTAAGKAMEAGHAELEADLVFDCQDASRLGYVEVGLFKAFPRMRQVDAEGVTPSGQFKRTLKRPATRLTITGR
jgi:hypothetical protein